MDSLTRQLIHHSRQGFVELSRAFADSIGSRQTLTQIRQAERKPDVDADSGPSQKARTTALCRKNFLRPPLRHRNEWGPRLEC